MNRRTIIEEISTILSNQNQVQVDTILKDGLSSVAFFRYNKFEIDWSNEEDDKTIVFKFYIGDYNISVFITNFNHLDDYMIGDEGNSSFEQVFIRIRAKD